MAGKNTAAFGIYSNRVQVEQGIDSLLAARFRNEDISVLFPAVSYTHLTLPTNREV